MGICHRCVLIESVPGGRPTGQLLVTKTGEQVAWWFVSAWFVGEEELLARFFPSL